MSSSQNSNNGGNDSDKLIEDMVEARTQAQEEAAGEPATEPENEAGVEASDPGAGTSSPDSSPEPEPEPEPEAPSDTIDTDPERTTKDLLEGKNKAAIEEAYTRCSEKIGKLKKAVWQTPPDLGKLAVMESTLDSFITGANEVLAVLGVDTKGSQ